jgi:hypothetical protein
MSLCALQLWAVQSPSSSKASLSWVGAAAACICIRRGQHVIDLHLSRCETCTQLHIHIPHAQMPVASCFPVLSSAADIKAALDPALFPLSLLLLPSASHWVLVLLELPCATPVLDSSTRLKDTAQGSLSLL